jgi:probable lipoprotein NlpC
LKPYLFRFSRLNLKRIIRISHEYYVNLQELSYILFREIPVNHLTGSGDGSDIRLIYDSLYTTGQMTRVRILAVLLLLTLSALLPGCGTFSGSKSPRAVYLNTTSPIDLNNSYLVQRTLYQQLRDWRGTPYKYGGLNRSGVDCSGFVYLTFRTQFGIQLPRSTEELIEVGNNVTGKRLEPGDLLFFSTGIFDRHVGIYLGGRNFIHASTNHGVIISNLNDRYWSSNFEEARRIR